MSRVSVSGPAGLNFQSRGHEETLEETLAAAGLISNDLIPVFLHYSSYKRGESIQNFLQCVADRLISRVQSAWAMQSLRLKLWLQL